MTNTRIIEKEIKMLKENIKEWESEDIDKFISTLGISRLIVERDREVIISSLKSELRGFQKALSLQKEEFEDAMEELSFIDDYGNKVISYKGLLTKIKEMRE